MLESTFFKKALTHNNQRCNLIHLNVDDFEDIPDNLKIKAHAVCMYKKKMLLAHHLEWGIWGLPGGTRKEGETIEETLKREIKEETNCGVVDFKPISAQKILNPNNHDEYYYRLQYICNVFPLADFKKDLGGDVNDIIWIEQKIMKNILKIKNSKK